MIDDEQNNKEFDMKMLNEYLKKKSRVKKQSFAYNIESKNLILEDKEQPEGKLNLMA